MTQPLFILAPPRSFTSVTCAMIGQHPEMMGLPETNLFAADTYAGLQRMYKMRPRFRFGLLRSVAQLGLGAQKEDTIAAASAWLEENPQTSTAELFRDLIAWAGGRGTVDKSPLYVYAPGALQRIQNAFPDARFLHLTREPRGTCESIFKTRQIGGKKQSEITEHRTETSALTPEAMWLNPHLGILEMLETVADENKMFLRGELFLEDPRSFLPGIAEWLGIRTDDEAIDAMMRPEDSPFACMGPRNAPLGNDPSFLKNPGLRDYKAKPADLDSPLSWDETLLFSEDVKECARFFGY